MLRTRITDLLGIRHPIVGGAMMYLTKAPLVAAISEAGALGVLASANYRTREEFREALQEVKALTSKPFAVNLNLFPMLRPIDNADYLGVLLEEGVRVVETSGHELPEELVAAIKGAGLTWIHKCAHPRHAVKAERMGADAVTVVGWENGGATGKLDVTTMVMVPATVDAVKVPVIGGGGVADGRGMAAVLALGAEGVIVGSRFVLAEECPVHPDTRQALLQAGILDTTLVMRSIGMTHRVLLNEAARRVREIEEKGGNGLEELLPYITGEQARKVYYDGDTGAGMNYISQAIGLMHDVKPAAAIVAEMAAQAEAILRRF
jgi:nitronate monooxygenase